MSESPPPAKRLKSEPDLPPNLPTYNRRNEAAAIDGHLYESKLMGLVLLRLQKQGCPFYVGSSISGIGNFDDIIVYYYCKNQSKWRLLFIQAKHRDDPEKKKITSALLLDQSTEKKDLKENVFNLHTNFDYLMLRANLNKVKDIIKENFQVMDIEVIIFTTAKCEPTLSNQPEHNQLLKTSEQGVVLKISDSEANMNELINYADNTLIKSIIEQEKLSDNSATKQQIVQDFLRAYKIYCNQSNQEEVGDTTKKELNDENPDLSFLIYHHLVQEYWKKKNKVAFLTETSDLLKEAKKTLNDQPRLLIELTKMCSTEIKKYNLQYTENSVQELLQDCNNRIVNVFSSVPELSVIKFMSYLEQKFGESFVFVNINQDGLDFDKILTIFIKFPCFRCLMIHYSNIDKMNETKLFLNEFANNDKQFFIITDVELSKTLTNEIPELKQVHDTCNGLADTTMAFQDSMLNNTIVKLQGRPYKLIELLGKLEDEDHIPRSHITGPILLKMLQSDSFEFAPLPDEPIPYYIERKLKRCNKADQLIETDELFIVENLQNIPAHKDLIVTSDRKRKFDEICRKCPNQNVHWFTKKSNRFLWQRSSKCLNKVRSLLSYDDELLSEIITEPVVIVTAEPGMGKSTMMRQLMRNASYDSLVWIMRVNLIEYSRFFKCERNYHNSNLAKKFFFNCFETVYSWHGTKGDELYQLEKSIFERCMLQGNIVFMADGFDEISPNYRKIGLELLQQVQKLNVRQLIITTRETFDKTCLEDKLNIFAVTIAPLTRKNIFEFLQLKWKSELNGIEWNLTRYNDFVTEFNKISIDKSFLNNPLHVYMIATCINNTFKDYLMSGEVDHLKKMRNELSLTSLIENFINIKIKDIYLYQKTGFSPESLFLIEYDFVKIVISKHIRLAIFTIFDKTKVNILLSEEEVERTSYDSKKIYVGRSKTEFVCQLVDDKPQFIHPTFLDFFAAQGIWKAIQDSSDAQFKLILQHVLIEYLIKNDKKQICQFMQHIALNEPTNIINKVTKGCLLLQSIGTRTLQFTETCTSLLLGLVECFIQDECIEFMSTLQTFSSDKTWALLKISAFMGYLNLVRILTKAFEIFFQKHKQKDTLWADSPPCLAALNSKFKIVEVFVKVLGFEVTFLDANNESLFSHLLNKSHYTVITDLLNAGINELANPYGEGHLPLYEAFVKQAPRDLIEALLEVTDVNYFNGQVFPNLDWYMLEYDQSVTSKLLEKGFNLGPYGIGET